MPKTELQVDEKELRQAIKDAEDNNTFANHAELFSFVSQSDWAENHSPKPVTPSIVMLRVKKYGIELKTPKGKRGFPKGLKTTRTRKKSNPASDNADLVESAPPEFKPMVLKILETNSKVGRLKLMCLQCVNWDRKEVKLCDITSCPLHPIRPYK